MNFAWIFSTGIISNLRAPMRITSHPPPRPNSKFQFLCPGRWDPCVEMPPPGVKLKLGRNSLGRREKALCKRGSELLRWTPISQGDGPVPNSVLGRDGDPG